MVTAAEGYIVFGIFIGLYIGVLVGMRIAEHIYRKTLDKFDHWRSR